MYVPPQTMWSSTPAPQGTPAPSIQTFAPGHAAYRILYTHGDDLLTPTQYRAASFEQALDRALNGRSNIPDDTLAKARAASATAFACIEYAAGAMVQPLDVQDRAGKALTNTPLVAFLEDANRLLFQIGVSLLVFGRYYLRKRYNAAGYPTALAYVNPTDVRELTERNRVVGYEITHVDNSRERVPTEQIVYDELFDVRPDGNGLSRLEVAFRAIGIDYGLVTHVAAVLTNSARPDGMLTFDHDLGNEDYEDARKEWQRFKGAQNAGKTAVMPSGAKWTPVQTSLKELDTSAIKQEDRKDIAAIIGVDLALVGLEGIADPLSANSTFASKEVAHLRNHALPRLKTVVLSALNKQWAHKDFNPRNTYTLVVDEGKIPALAEANLVKSEVAIRLSDGALLDYNESREMVGYAKRDDYILRDPTDVLSLFKDGNASMNQVRNMVGLPDLGANGEVVLISGIGLLPINRLAEVANKIADGVGQPPALPFGGMATPPAPPQLPPSNDPPALPAPEPTPDPESSAEPAAPTVARSAPSMELAVSFASHQFVRYARRALSEHLTARGVNAEWESEDAWRLTLVRADGQTPADAAALIRRVTYDDGRKIDTVASGYFSRDGGVYLRVADSDGLAGLRTAAALDVGIDGGAGYVGGILLCRTVGDVDLAGAPEEKYPMVLGSIVLLYDSEPKHTWVLRGVSEAQARELRNYEHVIRRKGRNHSFTVDTLQNSDTAAWVRDSLSADIDTDVVFEIAESILRGEMAWRNYEQTRANFIEVMRDLFQKAYDQSINRQTFAAQMRTRLSRFGLDAFMDGIAGDGEKPESLSPDQLTIYRAWQTETSGYITDVGEELFKREGITENEIDIRANLWASKSLNDIYYAGVRFGNPSKLATWHRGATEQGCGSCKDRDGQTMTIDEWGKIGFPQDRRLSCGGWRCQCVLFDEQGKLIGAK